LKAFPDFVGKILSEKIFVGKTFVGKGFCGKRCVWEKSLWEKVFVGKSFVGKGFPPSPNATVASPHKILTLSFQNFPSLRLSSAQINKRHGRMSWGGHKPFK
jgi:hypothetical protein